MIIFIVIFSFFTAFSADTTKALCLICKTNEFSDCYPEHILERHHETRYECFFCDYTPAVTPKKPTNYCFYKKHLDKEHTIFMHGLYWHYFGGSPQFKNVSADEKSLFDLANKIFLCFTCLEPVRGSVALYHFMNEFQNDFKNCTHCNSELQTKSNKIYLTYDFLKIIGHKRNCGFKEFNAFFQRSFPDLKIERNGNKIHLREVIKNIELLPEVYLCNLIVNGKRCDAVLEKGEVLSHIAKEICIKDSTDLSHVSCRYCSQTIESKYHFGHLINKHPHLLFAETLEIKTPEQND